MLNKKIKAFTLAEMLVTLALTSILVVFSYLGLSQIQKLLFQYRDQSFFVTQLNELNKRGIILFEKANSIQKESENTLVFKMDSSECKLIFNPQYILTVKNNQTDSFKVENKGLKTEIEELMTESPKDLIKKTEFDVYFGKQKFRLTFIKNYDAYSKLIIETGNGN